MYSHKNMPLTSSNKTSPCHLRSGTPLLETAAPAGGVFTAAAPVFTVPDPANMAVSQAEGADGVGESAEGGWEWGGMGDNTGGGSLDDVTDIQALIRQELELDDSEEESSEADDF